MNIRETIKEKTLRLIGLILITIPLMACYPVLLYLGLSIKIATIATVCLSIIAYILLVTLIEPFLGRMFRLRNTVKSNFFSTASIGNLPDYCIMEVNDKKIRLFDVVALTHDLPEHNLWRGQVGTVVEILSNDDAYEVEFSNRDGRTYQSLGFRAPQLMVLHHEPMQNPPISISKQLHTRQYLHSHLSLRMFVASQAAL